MLRSLKLNPLVIQKLEKFGDPLNTKIITERVIRPYVNKSLQGQTTLLNFLKNLSLHKD